jgi:26S proteasome regulatory subunit T6
MRIAKVQELTYNSIGGLDQHIKEFRDVIELLIKHSGDLALCISQPKSSIMFGPGTGKTFLSRAVVHHTDCILSHGNELVKKYIGDAPL